MGLKVKEDNGDLIALLKKDNHDALSYFFKLHHKSLCYFASRLIQNVTDAEDVVSDCFLKLWQHRHDFQTEQNIKAFLYISCRNGCLNYLKHLKVKSAAQSSYFNHLMHSEEDIVFKIIEAEFLSILNNEIEALPPKCREIFKLIYFDGKNTAEIAETLDLSVQTVRNQKTKAVELLRSACLKKEISAALTITFLLFLEKY